MCRPVLPLIRGLCQAWQLIRAGGPAHRRAASKLGLHQGVLGLARRREAALARVDGLVEGEGAPVRIVVMVGVVEAAL